MSAENEHEGFLNKLGGFFWKEFQPRFFALRGHTIRYYGDVAEFNANAPRGSIDLRACDWILHDDPKRYPADGAYGGAEANRRFTLRGPMLKHDYILEAQTTEAREEWIDAIANAEFVSEHDAGVFGGSPGAADSIKAFLQDSAKQAKVALSLTALGSNQELIRLDPKQAVAQAEAAGGGPGSFAVVNMSGDSVLNLAACHKWCSVDLFRELVKKGALLNARNFTGDNVLTCAIAAGRESLFVEALLDEFDINPLIRVSPHRFTALHLLAKGNRETSHYALMKHLLEHINRRINKRVAIANRTAAAADEGGSSSSNSKKKKKKKTVEDFSLINDVAGPDFDDGTPLFFAAGNASMHDDDLKQLIEAGADYTFHRKQSSSTVNDVPRSIMSERATSKYVLSLCFSKGIHPSSRWFERVAYNADDELALALFAIVENALRYAGKSTSIANCVTFDTLEHCLLQRKTQVVFDKLVNLGADVKRRKIIGQHFNDNSAADGGDQQQLLGDTLLHSAASTCDVALIDKVLGLGIDATSGAFSRHTRVRPARTRDTAEDASDVVRAPEEPPVDYAIDHALDNFDKGADVWAAIQKLLGAGCPATASSVAHAITRQSHEPEVFRQLTVRALQHAGRKTLAELDPDLMLSLVVNGGVDRASKQFPGCATIVDVAQILVQHGANANVVDECEDSALHGLVIRAGRLKAANVAALFRILIQRGNADPFLKNKKGQTVIECVTAKQSSLSCVLRVLAETHPNEVTVDAAAPAAEPAPAEAPSAAETSDKQGAAAAPAAPEQEPAAAAPPAESTAAAAPKQEEEEEATAAAPAAAEVPAEFHLKVVNQFGTSFQVTVPSAATIIDLKDALQRQESFEVERQQLTFDGAALDDDQQVVVKLSDGARIDLQLRERAPSVPPADASPQSPCSPVEDIDE